MENVYGTKKYFQSLGGAESDYYRNSSNRAVTNYSSYQNTLGRCSTGPYSHLNKFPYHSDAQASQSQLYGYNSSWAVWKDSRNLTPSLSYSSSKHNHHANNGSYGSSGSGDDGHHKKSVKSFTILLMTAAFIVMLAVLSVAGLAFYFSTFKSDLSDSIMVFDGKFMVAKGDVFTTGLKYNHTSVYQQKSDFYANVIVRSLENNGLDVFKCEITGFGDGPLITVLFRLYLDMRKIPMTIKSVEDHIKESIVREIISSKSLLKGIKIGVDTMEIKRLLNADVLKSASFIQETATTTSSALFDNVISTNNSTKLISAPKSKQNKAPLPTTIESEVDVENAPVILGSFEVTKTDADLTQKRTSSSIQTSTLRPFTITNGGGMKIKTKKITIEKVKIPSKATVETSTIVNRAKIESVNDEIKAKKPKVETTTTTTTATSTSKALTKISIKQPSTNLTKLIESTTVATSTEGTVTTLIQETTTFFIRSNDSNVPDPPKLDAHLFTVAPILDKEPWLPINPTAAVATIKPSPYLKRQQLLEALQVGMKNVDHVLPRNKAQSIEAFTDSPNYVRPGASHDQNLEPFKLDVHKPLSYDQLNSRNGATFSDTDTDSPNQALVYHSFSNPAFTFAPPGIEKLGTADVRPYPIPVNKISDETIPDFKYVASDFDEYQLPMNNGKYEHLGGGIIVKKSEPIADVVTTSYPLEVLNTETNVNTTSDTIFTEASARIGDLLLELLEIEREQNANNTTTIVPSLSSTEKTVNFNHIKDYVLSSAKRNDSVLLMSSTQRTFAKTPTAAPTLPTATASYVEIETVQYTPAATAVAWDQPSLFPVPSKPEFSLNGTAITPAEKQMIRRIFNETLQAWIVENSAKHVDPTDASAIDLQHKRNTSQHLQNISAIFDTLASKLGMSPNSDKMPPFKSLIGGKVKKNRTVVAVVASAVRPVTIDTSSRLNDKLMTPQPSIENTHPVPAMLETTQTTELNAPSSTATEAHIVGEAEIEEVDPTQYEQMLKQYALNRRSTTVPTPALITLMPVKSNSGLRFSRPSILTSNARAYGSNAHATPPPASVIRSQINVNE